jgi:nucleoside 2-deoxyribosyltransferase
MSDPHRPYYYLATPLHSFKEGGLVWDPELQDKWQEVIRVLEEKGLKITVALRDLDQTKSGSWLREAELNLIKNSQAIIVIMGNTPLTYFESGYAKGLGKRLYGIRTDNLIKMGPKVQEWAESAFDAVFNSPLELVSCLISKV